MIQEDTSKQRIPANYRPITCLPIVWKLVTAMVAGEIYRNIEENNVIGEQQEDVEKDIREQKII